MSQDFLAPGLYDFDALQPGDRIVTKNVTVMAQSIASFAALTGDSFEVHLSDAGAARHGFPLQVAHGLFVLSLIEGLKSTAPARIDAFAALGWNWSFRAPVFAGDTIRAEIEVASKRASADPTRGLLVLDLSAFNQGSVLVQRGQCRVMAYRRRG